MQVYTLAPGAHWIPLVWLTVCMSFSWCVDLWWPFLVFLMLFLQPVYSLPSQENLSINKTLGYHCSNLFLNYRCVINICEFLCCNYANDCHWALGKYLGCPPTHTHTHAQLQWLLFPWADKSQESSGAKLLLVFLFPWPSVKETQQNSNARNRSWKCDPRAEDTVNHL